MTSSSWGAVVRTAAIGFAFVWANAAWAQVPLVECPGDLTRISADRLVSDFEKLLVDYPDEPRIRHELGRVHLTVFAGRTSTLRACSAGLVFRAQAGLSGAPLVRTGLPWGPDVPVKDDWRPPTPEEEDSREGVRAREHLKKAIPRYEEAIARMRPRYLEHTLGSQWVGYGWALQQDGAPKDQVIAAYRNAVKFAWPDEQRINLMPPPIPVRRDVPGTFTSPDVLRVSETVARWLIPLLDPVRDQVEIATLSERAAALAAERKRRTR
jgi:hypothetical protein